MRLDSAAARPQPFSPATWCAVAALVVVLGGVALILMGCDKVIGLQTVVNMNPNYYVCECDCTAGFAIGASVGPTAGVQSVAVLSAPAGNSTIGFIQTGEQKTINGGPQPVTNGGVTQVWWQVSFSAGVDGWVLQDNLDVVSSPQLVSKDLSVCLPPVWNKDLPGFDHTPSPTEIDNDCKTDRIAPFFQQVTAPNLPPGSSCTCGVTTYPTRGDDTCSAPCLDPSGICVVAGLDPDPPAPDPVQVGLFAPITICNVDGSATIDVSGHTPITQPKVRGVVQIIGHPCPNDFCQVGISYVLKADDIEFDSGTIFASDPKFVDLSLSGASTPLAINLGPFFPPNDLGALPANSAFTTGTLRRSGSSTPIKASGRNTQELGVNVDWVNGTCKLDGPLGGQFGGDAADGTLDLQIDVHLPGVLVNQPPRPNAGANRTVECTSPQGAAVTLDASGSSDPDNNIAFYVWRRGSADGAQIGTPSPNPVVTTQQALGDTTYFVQVVDSLFSADSASVKVTVADTTAPVITCNAPATLTTSDAPVSFKATATDTCGPAPGVVISSFKCFEVKSDGRIVDKGASCQVRIQGSTITILDSGGVNDTVQWQASSTDAAGNVAQKTCQVLFGQKK